MKKDVVRYLAGRFIPAVVSIVVIILAIRYIGPEEYGRYSLALCMVILAVTMSYHWVQVSILRFLGSMPRSEHVVMGRFFDITLLSALASTALVIAGSRLFIYLNPTEMVLMAVFTFLNHFYLFHQAVLQAYHRSIRSAILEGVDQLIILFVLLAGLFLFGMNNALLLIAALTAGLIGSLLLRAIIRVKGMTTMFYRRFYWDSRFSGKVVEFGYQVALWLFFSQLLMSIDRFVLLAFFDYREAGIYSAGKDLLYKSIAFSIFPIYTSYQSMIGDEWNANHKTETWKKIKEAISFEILIFILFFIVFMVIKSWLFREFLPLPELDNWTIYLPVLLSAFLWQVVLLFQRFLDLALRSSFVLWTIGGAVLINLVLNLLLAPKFGMVAVSFSLLGASVFYIIILFARCVLIGRKFSC